MSKLGVTDFDRSDLKPCFKCRRGVMECGSIVFYEVTVAQCIADLTSIRQQHGLEVMMGSPTLAAALAPSTRVAQRITPATNLLCSDCAMVSTMPLEFIGEKF